MSLPCAALVAFAPTASARAADPPLTVPNAKLDAALVCKHPLAPGLDPMNTMTVLGLAGDVTAKRGKEEPRVRAEPKVRPLFLKKVR